MAQAVSYFSTIPNLPGMNNPEEVTHAKKKESGKEKTLDNNKKDSFTKEVEKAKQAEKTEKTEQAEQIEQINILIKDTIQEKPGEAKLLRFISEVVKKITNKVPEPLKNKLFAFIKNLLEQTQFSNNEKGDLLSSLLKKLQKKNEIDDSLLDSITELIASLDKNNTDITGQNNTFKSILGLIDEKNTKQPEIRQTEHLPKIVIIDLRKDKKHTQKEEGMVGLSKEPGNGEHVSNGARQKVTGTQTIEMLSFSVNETRNSGGQDISPGVIQKEFVGLDQAMIQKLKSSLENEMVKHTKIIIKQGGTGEIRIVLKPEALGRIRMRVHLENNHIDGRIYVENNNIKGIVETSLANLNAALKQEGYNSVSLHVSVGDGNPQGQQEKPEEYTAYIDAAEEFDKNVEDLLDPGIQFSRVNLVI